MDFFTLLWIFLLLSSLQPALRKRYLDAMRAGAMRDLQETRGSRVIALIHRQETLSFLGLPLVRYIDINDSEELLRAIKHTNPKRPIDLVLHTPGGLVLAAEQIAWALRDHEAKVTVFVPHYAMSGGTLISMAADEIVMDPHAVLGPVDPQLGDQAAASILKVIELKDVNQVDDKTLVLADLSRKAIVQVADTVFDLLQGRMPDDQAKAIVHELTTGVYTHDYPIRVAKARSLGLNVSTDMPEQVYKLMELYPQTTQRRPSVEYIPEPVVPRAPRHADGSDR
jgi:ClpP class serine protease